MKRLSFILKDKKSQRIINGVIFLFLIIWIITKLRHVYYASGIAVHYRFYLLKVIALIYLAQTILNKIWLNSLIKGIYIVLIIYVVVTYVYAFFDQHDHVMTKQFGVLIKSWGTIVKLSLLFILLWITHKMKPFCL